MLFLQHSNNFDEGIVCCCEIESQILAQSLQPFRGLGSLKITKFGRLHVFACTLELYLFIAGPNCEVNINECASNPCLHGSRCRDGINKFTCECKLGYTGTTCNQQINECLSNPCKNGATCFDRLGFYDCTCAPGFTGEFNSHKLHSRMARVNFLNKPAKVICIGEE